MCALRAHIKLPIFGNIFSKIEKVLTIFSISDKMFLKLDNLGHTLTGPLKKIEGPLLEKSSLSQPGACGITGALLKVHAFLGNSWVLS